MILKEAKLQVMGEDILSFDEWIEALDSLKLIGIESVTFLGPEPTLRNDFYNILQHSIDIFKNVYVQTYGLHETSYSEYNFTIVFLFESFNPREHNEYLKSRGLNAYNIEREVYDGDYNLVKKKLSAYEWALRKSERIKNKKIFRFKFYQNTDIMGALTMGWYYGADVVFEPFHNYKGEIKENRIVPNKENMLFAFDQCMIARRRFGINASIDTAPFSIFDVGYALNNWESINEAKTTSKEGFREVYITSNGDVYPSEWINFHFGNIKLNKPEDILKNRSLFMDYVISMPFGERCGNCLGRDKCGSQVNYSFNKGVRNYPNCPGPDCINWKDYLKVQLVELYQNIGGIK